MRFELMRAEHTNFQDWHHRPLGHSSFIQHSQEARHRFLAPTSEVRILLLERYRLCNNGHIYGKDI
jgi:hypothetical protein